MRFSEFLLTKYKAGIEFHPNLGFQQGTLYLGMGWTMLKRVCVFIGSALFLLLFTAISVFAQITTGDITGTVTDQSGAAVPGAQVSAVCTATNATRAVTTTETGAYRLTNLPVCLHKITVSTQGFKTQVRQSQDAAAILLKLHSPLQLD